MFYNEFEVIVNFNFILDQPKSSLDEDKLLVSEEDKKDDDEEPIIAVLDEPQNGEKPDVTAAVISTDESSSKNVNSGQVS